MQTAWHELPVVTEGGLLRVGIHAVVHENERPILNLFAQTVAGGDVLEMGFGLGISATEIQRLGCKSHTIIEAHPVTAARAREWAKSQPSPVTICEGYWQDVLPTLGTFDAALYDSFESSPTDRVEYFAAQIGEHLRSGGVFTGWSDMDPPNEGFLAMLLKWSDDVRFVVVRNVEPCATWRAGQRLIVPIARKR